MDKPCGAEDKPSVTPQLLEEVHGRLARVTIECLPYQDFIARYDRPSTLFYLDPPYWGLENLYGKGLFERADFERLSQQLKGLRGRFIMSMNDVPEIRRLFAWAQVETAPVTYKFKGTKRTHELIITGPDRVTKHRTHLVCESRVDTSRLRR